jgi:hypothetical protein
MSIFNTYKASRNLHQSDSVINCTVIGLLLNNVAKKCQGNVQILEKPFIGNVDYQPSLFRNRRGGAVVASALLYDYIVKLMAQL